MPNLQSQKSQGHTAFVALKNNIAKRKHNPYIFKKKKRKKKRHGDNINLSWVL